MAIEIAKRLKGNAEIHRDSNFKQQLPASLCVKREAQLI